MIRTLKRKFYFYFSCLRYSRYFIYSVFEKWTDLSSYQSSPAFCFMLYSVLNCVCSHSLLSNFILQKLEISKNIYCYEYSLLLWAFKLSPSLSNSVNIDIAEQLIYVYTQNMTLFVHCVHGEVALQYCAYLDSIQHTHIDIYIIQNIHSAIDKG